MQRRSLLRLGVGGAAVLALLGGGLALIKPGLRQGRLTVAGRSVFAAVAQAVLDGQLPKDPRARAAALSAQMDRLDDTIAGFPAAMQAEIGDLVTLLATAPGRIALTGLASDWSVASTAEVQAMLQSLRESRLPIRQQTYHALRDLSNGPFFADPSSWPGIGYPGPPPL